ncbi:MAG TPA: DNA repair protein RadA [Myxococcota bacterium]|jgi:DNA repair protein RadA/Sms|nr:DNA repair protein RadA [Myxococcota bacterium]
MAKARSVYACTECGAQAPRWLGRCPECGAWSSLVEEAIGPGAAVGRAGATGALSIAPPSGAPAPPVVPLREIEASHAPRLPCGIDEVDRVLGGGLVPGSVLLLGGEPGIGKSTLALQIAARVAARGGGVRPVLYVSGEESPEQVRLRAERLEAAAGDVFLLPETRVEAIVEPWRKLRPALVLVDSIQTLRTERIESAAGSVAQVRECAAMLSVLAKSEPAPGPALLLIGHVTKEGTLAGPRVLEHLVDVVLNFEGERAHPFRVLRAAKNRFGSTAEIGVFHMGEQGLEPVSNPSEMFLAERRPGAPGSCIVPLLEGSRPMLVELQSLVAPAGYGTARRTCLGIDDGRVALLLAVLDRNAGVDLVSRDVYVNVTGGVRVIEPAADLGLVLALASSRLDLALPPDAAACGEVGLGGEVRRVSRLDLRLREAARLGFRRVLLPELHEGVPAAAGARAIPVRDVAEAVAWLRREGVRSPSREPVDERAAGL